MKSIPQKAIAKKLGTTQQAVSKVEQSKKIHEETFKKHFEAMSCSLEDLEKIKVLVPSSVWIIIESTFF